MKKRNEMNGFENSENEKQNSLSSGIRIGLEGNYLIIGHQFVRINEAEYATDFDFFLRNQVQVIQHTDKTMSICSCLESRCFKKSATSSSDEETIMQYLHQIHLDIISLKYGGEFVK
jgi:hypothetical protein